MRDSVELKLTNSGLKLHPKHAHPLGLRDGAECWGSWLHPRLVSNEKLPTERNPNRTVKQLPHLIIAVPHPDRWPAVFFIEARLERDVNALPRFFKQINDLGINVISVDTATASYRQTYITLLCEHPNFTLFVRKELRSLDTALKGAQRSVEPQLRDKVLQRLGLRLLTLTSMVYAELRVRHKNKTYGEYLNDNALMLGGNPWFLCRKHFKQDALDAAFKDLNGINAINHQGHALSFIRKFNAEMSRAKNIR